MRIVIETILQKDQRYHTVGDWQFDGDTLNIKVSETGDNKYNALIGIHEAIEALLCEHRGIKEEAVTVFDKEFETKRVERNTNEPGDDKNAPYRKEHFFATSIERLIAGELKVNWAEYEKTINDL